MRTPSVKPSVCQLPGRGAFWFTANQKLSPRAGDSSRARPVGDAARGESGGIGSIASGSAARRPYSNQRCGCECNEQTEGLQRGFCCLRQPLSQTFGLSDPRPGSLNSLRKFAYSEFPAPLLRRATPVGTRSSYSLPFVILPVPARSPFRFISHWRRSTPNPSRGAFWRSTNTAHSAVPLRGAIVV